MTLHTENVANDLRDRILRGVIPPGAHLQELQLSEQLNVSRTPIRSALALLASEGLVEYTPKRGYRVRSFSLEDIVCAHLARANLEGLACRLAAERGLTPGDILKLERTLDIGDAILARGQFLEEDHHAWAEMNDLFHGTIIDIAGNRILADLIDRTCIIPLGSHRVIHWYDPVGIKSSHDIHHRIYRYIRDRCGVNAESLMREHILLGIDQIRLRAESGKEEPRTESLSKQR